MKSVRLAALGAAIVFGVSTAAAQAPVQSSSRAAVASDTTRARPHGARRQGRAARPGKGVAQALFRDVNLTTAQRDQLRVIQKKYAEQRKTLVQQIRGQNADAAARPDSATRARVRTETGALMQKQVAEMRAVLTPPQQQKFDANYASVRDQAKTRHGKHAKRGA